MHTKEKPDPIIREMSTQELLRTFNAVGVLLFSLFPCNEETLEDLRKEIAWRKVKPIDDRVLNIIKRCKKIEHRQLLQRCSQYANAQDIVEAIASLQAIGSVDVIEEGTRGKKVYLWKELMHTPKPKPEEDKPNVLEAQI